MNKCAVENCNNKTRTNLYCATHHKCWIIYGDPQKPIQPKRGIKKIIKNCVICGNVASAKLKTDQPLCDKHYQRLLKYGDPTKILINERGMGHTDTEGRKIFLINGKSQIEYRMIMEKELGRSLRRDEWILHKDGNLLNNEISNLELFVTGMGYGEKRICKNCNVEKSLIEFNYTTKENGRVYFRKSCKACDGVNNKIWRQENAAYVKEYHKEYNRKNRDRIREYERNHYLTTPSAKIAKNLRIRMRDIFHGDYRPGSVVEFLGCLIEDFKKYLENKWYKNPKTGEMMSWKNYGVFGWHIDHIIPLSDFDLTDPEQFKKACHYTNLQPMWCFENWKKRDF